MIRTISIGSIINMKYSNIYLEYLDQHIPLINLSKKNLEAKPQLRTPTSQSYYKDLKR